MSITPFLLLKSIMLSRALFVAAELDLAQYLQTKPLTSMELALATNTNPEAMSRLLRFLAASEVFINEDEHYRLNEFSQTMLAKHPNTIKPFLLHDDETRWNCFGNLGYSIRTGKPAFDEIYKQDYFSYLQSHENLNTRFNQAMQIISTNEDALIASKINFDGIVADIGGGIGQLINQIAINCKIKQGILVDLPQVVNEAHNLAANCIKSPRSFFEPLNIQADIFILKRILHDWDDQKALLILKNICNTMHPDSKLYIIDGILDKAQDPQLLGAIDLALLTIFNGKERTKKQFEDLITTAGLKIVTIKQLNETLSLLECVKN